MSICGRVVDELEPKPGTERANAFGSSGDYARLKGFEPIVAAKAGMFTAGAYTGRKPGPTWPLSSWKP